MKATDRNEELTESCDYEIVQKEENMEIAYWKNEQNKINKAACDKKWQRIRNAQ